MKGLFVVGTDTGVGKTLVSTTIVRAWARAGHRVAPMKPCETGDGDDTEQLMDAAERPLDRTLVNPYRFTLPAAPSIAARREGATIELAVVERSLERLAAEADRVIVEAAGGLLVPWSDSVTTAELIRRLNLPVLVVARTGLGTINHTLLTLEALRRRGARVLGLVLSRTTSTIGAEEEDSIAYVTRAADSPCFGTIPWLTEREPIDRQLACARHIDTEALFRFTS